MFRDYHSLEVLDLRDEETVGKIFENKVVNHINFETNAKTDIENWFKKYNNGKIIENKKIGNDYEELKKFLFNYDIYKMNSEKNKGEILNFFSSENIADLYKRSFENVMKRYK